MSGLISNGTYVLGDPNTRELYVQSPLTTGMSGTSAYIGVDTSALPGNETVLWSGSATSGYYNLSEAFTNFNKIEITLGCAYGYTNRSLHPDQIVDTQYLSVYSGVDFHYTDMIKSQTNSATNPFYDTWNLLSAVNSTQLYLWPSRVNFWYAGVQSIKDCSATFNQENSTTIYKIVGINRKEV